MANKVMNFFKDNKKALLIVGCCSSNNLSNRTLQEVLQEGSEEKRSGSGRSCHRDRSD